MNTYTIDTRSAEFQHGVDLVRAYQRQLDAKLAEEHPLATRLRRCLSKRRSRRHARAMVNLVDSYAILKHPSWTNINANTTLLGTLPRTVCTGPNLAASVL